MAASLNAVQVAALPAAPSTVYPSVVQAGDASPGVAKAVAFGETTTWPGKVNANGAMIDLLATALGRGVLTGLGLSATGLAMTVADGIALMDGVVEAVSVPTYTLPANQSRVWIWLKRDGTIAHTTTLTAPGYHAVLLGSCQTGAAGLIGAFDSSGVIYVVSGILWRETADAGAPGDTLDAGLRVFTKTAGGTYLWTGAAHVQLA